MLQIVFADQCNIHVHRNNAMAYFDLIPNFGKNKI